MRGPKTSRLSTNVSLYIENGIRQTPSFFEMRIGSVCALSNDDFADDLQ